MVEKIQQNLYLLVGLVLTSLLFITNYTPGSFLVGWDNLQTDLNPALGVKRAFFGVWQEYQSFGLLGGLSHSADLVRAIFVAFLAGIVPNHLVRFLFHLILILAGFLGMARFCQDFSFKEKKALPAVLGAVFYILNFGTIQILGLPWEAFSTLFAFLPWEIWIFLKLLSAPINRKSLLLLFFINFLATPQAYIQTIFVSYLLILSALWFGVFLKNRTWAFLKKSLIIFSVILGVNLFWILPQIYFLKTSAHNVHEAKANILSTDDLKFINRDKGDLISFMKLEGFYYEFRDHNQQFIFANWKKHFQTFPIMFFPYILFGMAFFGFFFIPKFKIAFFLAWAIVAFALLSSTFPFSTLHQFLKQTNLLGQVFRSPFSKFIIFQVFLLSYFFSIGVYKLNFLKNWYIQLAFFGTTLIFIFVTFLPVFKGNFFAPQTRVQIPKEYFNLFDFFKYEDRNKRIALLPDTTFWGWFINSWGYNGSGFLWYNIEQPIVSRNFDVWSDKSEGYFWEIKTALEAEDTEALKSIFNKYQIDFLVLDKSIMPNASSIKAIQYDRLDALLKKTPGISLVKQWNYLFIYKIDHPVEAKDFVFAVSYLPNIGPKIKFTNLDSSFLTYGVYQTDQTKIYQAFYPFLDLFTQTQKFSPDWKLSELQSQWQLNRPLPFKLTDFELLYEGETKEILTYKNNSAIEFSYPLSVNTDNQMLTVQFPKILVSKLDLLNAVVINCGYGYGDIETEKERGEIILNAKKGAAACLTFKEANLGQQYGYLIKINNKNIEGQRLLFYVLDSTKSQSFLEDRLVNDTQYYILPPKYQFGIGYEFNFRNSSYEKIPAINNLEDLSIYLLPYDKLKQTVFINRTSPPKPAVFEGGFIAKKHNYFLYEVSLSSPHQYIILNQAYHPGWRAFGLNGKELKDHFLVNNWANGWKVASEGTVIIIFLPQLLQFLGFGIFGLTLYYLK